MQVCFYYYYLLYVFIIIIYFIFFTIIAFLILSGCCCCSFLYVRVCVRVCMQERMCVCVRVADSCRHHHILTLSLYFVPFCKYIFIFVIRH